MDLANNWCALTSVACPEKRNCLHDADKLLSISAKKSYNIIGLFVIDGKKGPDGGETLFRRRPVCAKWVLRLQKVRVFLG